MGWPFSVRLLSFSRSLECRRPPQQVINHRLGLRPKLSESFVHVAALVMRPKGRNRNVDGRANRGDLDLYHGFPELLDAARAHGAAVAYESSRLAVPLRINPVDGIFEHRRGAVVIFRSDENKPVRCGYCSGPAFDNII